MVKGMTSPVRTDPAHHGRRKTRWAVIAAAVALTIGAVAGIVAHLVHVDQQKTYALAAHWVQVTRVHIHIDAVRLRAGELDAVMAAVAPGAGQPRPAEDTRVDYLARALSKTEQLRLLLLREAGTADSAATHIADAPDTALSVDQITRMADDLEGVIARLSELHPSTHSVTAAPLASRTSNQTEHEHRFSSDEHLLRTLDIDTIRAYLNALATSPEGPHQ